MNIYHYHPETGAFLGEGTADASPLEPGVWLIPAHATAEKPSRPGEGKQAVWTGAGWDVQPIPEPEPKPEPEPVFKPVELTPAEKLAAAGLTVAELRELLGLG
jgi:hypothetical protein